MTTASDSRGEPAAALSVVPIDLADERHTQALLALLDEYARGPTGRGYGLASEVRERLADVLRAREYYLGFLAFVGDEPAGVVNCFEGVSTFRAQPLLNIHDIAVAAPFQRRGIGRALLHAVETAARARGCCKITLEVLEGNDGAVKAYLDAGFEPFELDPAMGRALFFERKFY